MNKILIILLIIVFIQIIFNKLFNYKEGYCPTSCSNCKYINVKSIINGGGDCGKECINCSNIAISDYLKLVINNLIGTIYSGDSTAGDSTSNISISNNIMDINSISGNLNRRIIMGINSNNSNTITSDQNSGNSNGSSNSNGSGNSTIGCTWDTEYKNSLWTDASNCNMRPSLFNCNKDASNNWFPYKTGASLCALDSNGIWRYSRDVTDKETETETDECEPVKCVADFGTEIGQLTCCGQNSVLKSTKYVCPSNLPVCNKFKCGSEFGTCSK